MARTVARRATAQDALIQLRAATGNAADAAKNLFGQQGLQAGNVTQGTIHGNRVVSGEVTAATNEGGSVRGIATFIEYGRGTFQITAYTPLSASLRTARSSGGRSTASIA